MSGPEGSSWAEPVPFGPPSPPPFPSDVLPNWAAEFVAHVATATQTPQELPAAMFLAAISALAARRVFVAVHPGWDEHVALWVVAIAETGAGKTPVMNIIFGPLERWEAEAVLRAMPKVEAWRSAHRIAETQLKAAESAAAKAVQAEQANAAATVKAALEVLAVVNAERVAVPRLFAEDVTPESVPGRLQDHGGRLCIKSDEGGPLAMLSGRYSDGEAHLESHLKAYSGTVPLRVDRVGRASEFVANPQLVMALAVQPGVVADLARRNEMLDRGFLARVTWFICPDVVGFRNVRAAPLTREQIAGYESNMRRVADGLDGLDMARLTLTEEAREELAVWAEGNEVKMQPDGLYRPMVDWANKLRGLGIRLAATLAVADALGMLKPAVIEADTMRRAIRLADFLAAHALRARWLSGQDPLLEHAEKVLKNIRAMADAGTTSFKVGQLQEQLPSKPPDVRAALPVALKMLEEHGFIRPAPIPEHRRPGRPAECWLINPSLSVTPRNPPVNPVNGESYGLSGLFTGRASAVIPQGFQ